MIKEDHPCQRCGACCSIYRVAFSANELQSTSLQVPSSLTFKSGSSARAMKTVSSKNLRCVALEGHIGESVSCRIYANRPSPCRNFKASFEDGLPRTRCDDARRARGLAPLTPEDWIEKAPQEKPKDVSF